jgi:Ethanolamine utilization protein EutJ (predicted chaperonin)
MANPNIVNVTQIYGVSNVAALTSSTANIVTNPSGSNEVLKLNSVSVGNYSSGNITCNVMINRSGTVYYFAGNVTVPSYSTLIVVGKDNGVYLNEGDVLQANCNASSAGTIIASYDEIG